DINPAISLMEYEEYTSKPAEGVTDDDIRQAIMKGVVYTVTRDDPANTDAPAPVKKLSWADEVELEEAQKKLEESLAASISIQEPQVEHADIPTTSKTPEQVFGTDSEKSSHQEIVPLTMPSIGRAQFSDPTPE
ncbi:hypothetical protein MMARV_C024P1, partial [viral metagenome]